MSGSVPYRRIAVMQPYLFPYIGYFQLMQSVDCFLLLDTVQFIRGGWMNRNTLRVSGKRALFSIPVASAPSATPISDRQYAPTAAVALAKLQKTFEQSYTAAPNRRDAAKLIDDMRQSAEERASGADFTTLTEFALRASAMHIGVTTPIRRISELALSADLMAQDRIIAACQAVGASEYVNMAGGRALYSSADFADAGIQLFFLEPGLKPYNQAGASFEPGLSILDVIAHARPECFADLLEPASIRKGAL